MTIETRKYELIKQITSSSDEALIAQLEQVVKQKTKTKLLDNDLSHFVVNIENELHIEQLMKEQKPR